MRRIIGASLVLAAAAALSACGSVTVPPVTGTPPVGPPSATTNPGPAAGSRAEAATLARLLLARLILPPGAARMPQTPLPASLSAAAYAGADVTPSLDQYQLFALAQPMDAAAGFLTAQVPPGLSRGGTGEGSGPDGVTMREVTDTPRSVPAGIAGAQVVLTVVPAASGGSLLRADAQVTWYPARTAAEYIDPARYHVLSVTVQIGGRRPHTVHQVVTSQAFIARLARALDQMQAEPLGTVACPAIFAEYQLAFSVSRASRPGVVVSSNDTGCGGAGIIVNGRPQPPLTDQGGAVAALVDHVVHVSWGVLARPRRRC
jgi:hypothetical protein